ncbi:primosomal protein N', partial [Elioraea sp. Yellowstone]
MPVLLPLPLAGAYDYAVPEAMEVAAGAVVTVPLGPRLVHGVVWHGTAAGTVAAAKLRAIASVVPTPPLKPALMRFIDWVADYTLSAPGEVLRMALPIPAATEVPRPRVGWRLAEAPAEGARITAE